MPEIKHNIAPLPAGAVATAPTPATEATVKEVAQAIVDKVNTHSDSVQAAPSDLWLLATDACTTP